MPTSAITVRMSAAEYSRYYRPTRYVTTYVTATGAADGVIATAELTRSDGYGKVASKTATIASAACVVTFDLAKDCADVDGIYRAKQGSYTVHVTVNDSVVTGDSNAFDILIVTVRELKERFLRGVDLLASNTLRARQQPRTITGVLIDDASMSHFTGIFVLSYDRTAKTLSWGNAQFGQGVAVTVDTSSVNEYLLMNAKGTAYIQVSVTGPLLPVGSGALTENIVIDHDSIEEEELRTFLLTATAEVQSRLMVRLEPTEIDTEDPASPLYNTTNYPPTTFAEEYAQPQTYYRPDYLRNWLTVKFPYAWLLKITRLEGWFNSSKAFAIPISDWIVKNKVSAEVEFVAKQGALMSWQFTGLPFFAFMYTFAHIPSFWHYHMTVGLDNLDMEVQSNDRTGARVRDCIARWATIDILALAGQAAAPGLVSESTSRDGVSESRAYAQGKGGKYADNIQQHQEFLTGVDGESGELLRLRKRLLGIYFTTL